MAKRKVKTPEELHEENELLKLKMMAEFGGEIVQNEQTQVPPEVENIFLKHVQKFQRAHAQAQLISIHKLIKEPVFYAVNDLDDKQVSEQLEKLLKLLDKNGVVLHYYFTVLPRELYRFITEELFIIEVENIRIKGLKIVFSYEDFYPNPKMDAIMLINDALSFFYEKEKTLPHILFDDDFKDANGLQCDIEDLLARVDDFHHSYIKGELLSVKPFDCSLSDDALYAYTHTTVEVAMQLQKGRRKVKRKFDVELWLENKEENGRWLINRVRFDFD